MPYQLRNRTRVANTELTPSSAASSATLEHNEDEADERPLNRELGTKRLRRSCGVSEGDDRTFQLPLARNTVLTRIRITERDPR